MKKLIISIVICTIFVATGCSDVKDIDECYLPTIISFDENNVGNTYSVNLVMMNFKNGKVLNEFAEFSENTISKSIECSQKSISGDTSMSLLQTIVLGEEFSKKSTYNLVNWAYKENVNGNLSMCVYKGKSKELINKLNSKEDQDLKKDQNSESKSQTKDSKKELSDKLSDFIKLISTKKEEGYEVIEKLQEFTINNESYEKTALLPTIQIKGEKDEKDEKVEIVGTTIFKHYDNIGEIDLNDTRSLMLLRGIKTSGVIEFKNLDLKNNKSNDKLNIFNSNNIDKALEEQSKSETSELGGVVKAANKRKVEVEKSDDKYIFNVVISLNCNVLENNNGTINIITNSDNIKAIEKSINSYIEEECNEFVSKVCKDIKYDIFDLSKYAKVKYKESIDDLKDHDFFKNSEIKIKVDSKIKNTSLFN